MRKRNGGFTLIEVVLYLGLSAALLLFISITVSLAFKARIEIQAAGEVEDQGLQILAIITRALRNSESVIFPGPGESGDVLNLNFSDPRLQPTIFSIVGNRLSVSEAGGSAAALHNDRVVLSDLSFSNLARANSPDTVRIVFTLSHYNLENRSEYDYEKKFYGAASLRK